LSPIHRIVLSWLCVGFFLAVFLQPIGAAAPQEIPIEPLPPGVVIETVVSNATQLVAMDFTPDGRLLYTERTGNLQVVVNRQAPVTAYPFPVLTEGERGLLGVAVDPNFVTNHFVWVYFTKRTALPACGGRVSNRVVRITLNDDNSVPADPEGAGCFPVYQPAPGYYVSIHNGGNLHFGPDGKLYVSVGNSNEEITDPNEPAQNLASPLGKIHRYNPTIPLSIPADNPFVTWRNIDKSNYAYGLRNPFDFTFDPVSQQMFATDNGDECDDEINLFSPATTMAGG
jgi:glucose/arabinose dehydrogenase